MDAGRAVSDAPAADHDRAPCPARAAEKSVVVIGAGNIGAAGIPHLGRNRAIRRVTVIDRDRYEPANLAGQDITPADVGRSKAGVQVRRLKQINPSLEVEAIVEDVANVPLGRLRCDVILACLDSKAARQVVNQAAWRLGTPWIDAGVNAVDGLLARVCVYLPGAENAACLECAWDERAYATLEQARPCAGGGVEVAPTNAPSSLGALAAALQMIECEKLLAGRREHLLAGREVTIDARSHRHLVTALRRRPDCRFDHGRASFEPLDLRPGELTFGQALDLGRRKLGGAGDVRLRVESRPFVTKLLCSRCGVARDVVGLLGRLGKGDRRCRRCDAALEPMGFHTTESLTDAVRGALAGRSLESLGFRAGDLFYVDDGRGRVAGFMIECDRR